MDHAVTVFPEPESLSQAAARRVISLAQQAIAERGRFSLVLAGGRTPKRLYEILASQHSEALDWDKVHLFWGDERYVPHDHEQSNCRMAREALVSRLPFPAQHVHPMPTHFEDPNNAAQSYADTLVRYFLDDSPVFDLVLLGMGADGHTASLFPGAENSEERKRWVVPVLAPAEPRQRLSLTLPLLTQARNTLFLVTGADKRPVLTEMMADPLKGRYAAGLVHAEGRQVEWFLDEAARPQG